MKKAMALCLALVLLTGLIGMAPTQRAEAATNTAVVVGGWLRLRSAPSFDAVTVASYFTGTVVTILGSSGAWYQVSVQDGRTGYMYGKYLSVGGGGGGGSDNVSATVVSSNGKGVRLRTGPSTGYGVIAVYPVGTAATILARGNYWHYVRIGSRTGYMMSQFLSTGTPDPNPGTGYLARVTSKNGYGVRLRSGAGKGYAVLGVYSVGTEVTVLKHGSVWDYIRVGSRTGYMMTEFLTTSGVATNVTAVSLNNMSPAIGDVLTATTTPSGATVTYLWADQNGTTLGTGATYTVNGNDTGRKIRVTVTGNGSYSGTATSAFTNAVSYRPALNGVTIDNTAPYVGATLTAVLDPAEATATYLWYRDDGQMVSQTATYVVQSGDVNHRLYVVATGNGSYSGDVASFYTDYVTLYPNSGALTGTVTLPAATNVGATIRAVLSLNSVDVNYQWYINGKAITSGGTGATYVVPQNAAGATLTVVITAKPSSGYTGSITSSSCVVAGNGMLATPSDLTK